MKVPLEWLKSFVPVRLAPQALAERLTLAGLEVVGALEADGQPVFDLEITPNRPDCLSILGVARETAAITGQRLTVPAVTRAPAPRLPSGMTRPVIRIEDRKGCARYIGRLFTNIRIGPSPDWMQRRLLACGARPINNVVDITNYVLFEYGQPLHAFDYARLAEGKLVVRGAAANEKITTLDGVTRALAAGMLVIADAQRPVAVAGVMGGAGSEVTQGTTQVLLESAWFDPVRVRRTARQLGLASDSSYRFERGVDPLGVEAASRRAAQLLAELAGGQEVAVVDAGALPKPRAAITLDVKTAQARLGVPLSGARVKAALTRLGCRVAGTSARARVTPPTFRADLKRDVDLYEELARLIGYDRIPGTVPCVPIAQRRLAPADAQAGYAREQDARALCASLGLDEAITWSLVSEPDLAQFGWRADQAAKLVNPLSQEHAYLRPSLLMGLAQVVRRNLTQGASSVRVFELGNCTSQGREAAHLGMGIAGMWARDWKQSDPADFYRLKGLVRSIVARLHRRGAAAFAPTQTPWAESGHAAQILWSGQPIGVAGQLAARIGKALDLDQPVWLAELDIASLLDVPRPVREAKAPAIVPPVKRDLSFVIGHDVAFDAIDRTIRQVAGTVASRIELIDRYTGAPVPQGKVSLTFSIEYRDASRTLTAAEVDALHQRISQTLTAQFGAQLR